MNENQNLFLLPDIGQSDFVAFLVVNVLDSSFSLGRVFAADKI